jgi:hypothetical protein
MLEFLQTSEDHGEIYNKFRELGVSFMGFIEFLNISAMEKPMDQVHGVVGRRRGWVHGGLRGCHGQ